MSPAGRRFALFVSIPAVGHANPLLAQARELNRRGWRTALASTEGLRAHVEGAGVTFVDLGPKPWGPEYDAEIEARTSAEADTATSAMLMVRVVNAMWPAMYDALLPYVRAERPDVIVADLLTTVGIDVAHACRLPYVLNNPDILAILPANTLPPLHGMPLFGFGRPHRRVNWLEWLLTPYIAHLAIATMETAWAWESRGVRRARRLPLWPRSKERYRTLIMVNSAFGIEYPRPLPPLVRMVGPMIEAEAAPLPQELSQWLAAGPPVVYVNLGTIARPRRNVLARLARGLSSEGTRVLWSLREPLREWLPRSLPPNIRLEGWLPSQMAVLRQPNVRAFVSHCGINSVHESLSCGVPVVGLPILADQGEMAMRVQHARVGLMLDKQRFTPGQLSRAIRRVLNEPSFAARIPAIQASFEQAGGIPRAADLIEHVAMFGAGDGRDLP